MKHVVIVKPGSSKGPLVVVGEGGLTVYVRERAVDGKANEAVVAAVAKHFAVPKACVSIKVGLTARKKIVEVEQT